MRNREKGFKNLFYGVVAQVIILALGLILPRLFIVTYGSEVNGLLSSVKQVFAYMTLLEAGVGTTTLQALYKPIASNNRKEISSILSATNSYYKKTGVAYAALVIIIAFVYSFVVNTDIPFITIFFVVTFQGSAGVIKYLFQAKYTLLMQADGKSYILSNLTLFVTVLSDVAQIILIYAGFDIVAVKFSYFVINLIQMIYIVTYIKKNYGWIDLNTEPNYEALSQRNSALIHSISGMVFNNTDTILLTLFCGLSTVSVYSVYSLIFNVMANIIEVICDSFKFALGQLFQSNFNMFKRMQDAYESVYLAITFAFLTVIYIFILPFVTLYTDSVTDIVYIDKWLPVLFVAVNALNYGRRTSNQIINFAGHFKQTQYRALAEMIINLVVSLICVNIWGIHGVLVGTIAALLYRANDIIIYANVNIMKRTPFQTYKRWGINVALFLILSFIASKLPMDINSYVTLLLYGIPVTIVVFLVFIISPFVYEKGLFKIVAELLRMPKKRND